MKTTKRNFTWLSFKWVSFVILCKCFITYKLPSWMKYDYINTCTTSQGWCWANTARKGVFLKTCLSTFIFMSIFNYYYLESEDIKREYSSLLCLAPTYTNLWIALLRSLHSIPPFPAYTAPWTGDRSAVHLHLKSWQCTFKLWICQFPPWVLLTLFTSSVYSLFAPIMLPVSLTYYVPPKSHFFFKSPLL